MGRYLSMFAIAIVFISLPIYSLFYTVMPMYIDTQFVQFYLWLGFFQVAAIILGTIFFSWLAFIVVCTFIAVVPFIAINTVIDYWSCFRLFFFNERILNV